MLEETSLIYGKHAVREALAARPDVIKIVYLDSSSADVQSLDLLAKGILRKELNLRKLPKGLPQDAAHQGAVAEIDVSKLMVPYEEFIRILDVTYDTGLVLLGEVQDPQNVGAVIRSAAAFGIAGVLIPEHRQAQVNGTVIKVSAGMAFRIPLVRIGNVNTVVENLKEHGFWIYGLDGSAEKSVSEEKFEKPSVLILGNESTGIREKTLMHSDIPLRIPMSKKAESLNAAAAAAIVLSVWSTHHRNALN